VPKDGIERAADLIVSNAYWNPRPLERDGIRDLIARAWSGDPLVVTGRSDDVALATRGASA
jgi:hypothetical protein